jgi:hypothetical protein
MGRQGACRRCIVLTDPVQVREECVSVEAVRQRVVADRHDLLAEVDGKPAGIEKHALAIVRDDAPLSKQFQAITEGIGDSHRAAVAPEVGVIAFRRVVMENQEIPYTLLFECGDAIELGGEHGIEAARREQVDQVADRQLNQVNAR